MKDLSKITQAVENLLNVKPVVRQKKKRGTTDIERKKLFQTAINNIEQAFIREQIMFRDFGIDQTGYNEIFYQAFDSLLMLQFGDYSKIIYFYLYERKNPDGTLNILRDEEGNEIKLDNANDLWELIKRLKPLND